jgi:hypothetical protein
MLLSSVSLTTQSRSSDPAFSHKTNEHRPVSRALNCPSVMEAQPRTSAPTRPEFGTCECNVPLVLDDRGASEDTRNQKTQRQPANTISAQVSFGFQTLHDDWMIDPRTEKGRGKKRSSDPGPSSSSFSDSVDNEMIDDDHVAPFRSRPLPNDSITRSTRCFAGPSRYSLKHFPASSEVHHIVPKPENSPRGALCGRFEFSENDMTVLDGPLAIARPPPIKQTLLPSLRGQAAGRSIMKCTSLLDDMLPSQQSRPAGVSMHDKVHIQSLRPNSSRIIL